MKNGWKEITIGKLVGERAGNLNPSSYPDETFNYYSIPAYQEAGEPVEEVGKNIRSQKQIVEFGTVLFGKLNPRVEKVWIVDSRSSLRKIASTEWISVPVRLELANPRFIYYLFWSDQVMLLAKALVAGSTPSRQRVDPKSFFEIPVSLPPLPEQKKIAAVLLKIQRAIETQGKIIQSLRELKKSTMQHLFTHGLHGEKTKMTEIGEIPESWKVVQLGQIASIERGRFTHRPRNDPAYYGGDTPFIQTGDITQSNGRIRTYTQTLNQRGLSVSKVFAVGTILITIAANIGDTGILEFDSAFPDSIIGITPSNDLDGEYLEFYLQTQKHKMNLLAPKGTQKNINIEFLKPWPVKLAPTSEQKEIAHTLGATVWKLEMHESKKAALQDLFKTTLNRLMTGEIRVNDLDIDVSEMDYAEQT